MCMHCCQIWDSAYAVGHRKDFVLRRNEDSDSLNSSSPLFLDLEVVILVRILKGQFLSATREYLVFSSDDTVMEQHLFTRQLQRSKTVSEETSYLKMLLYTVCSHAHMIFVHDLVSNDGPGIG